MSEAFSRTAPKILFNFKVITVTAIDENDSPVHGCSVAAIVSVSKASTKAKDSTGTTHLTSKTQAIITAEDASSPGKLRTNLLETRVDLRILCDYR